MTTNHQSPVSDHRRRCGIVTRLWVVALLTILSPPSADSAQRTYGDVDSVKYHEMKDGDTFTATIPGWPRIIGDSIKVRISGIDCHEIRSNQDSSHPAQQAKRFSRAVLENAQIVSLKDLRRGSFFRIIADVEVDGDDLGQMLLEEGLAFECDRQCSRVWVYASRTGQSYHLRPCRHLARTQDPDRLTLEDARDRDLAPCKTCKPPGFEDDSR